MLVALEQVLDRMERGEIRSRQQLASPRASAFVRIASEIRKSVEEAAQSLRQPPGTPPSGTTPTSRNPKAP